MSVKNGKPRTLQEIIYHIQNLAGSGQLHENRALVCRAHLCFDAVATPRAVNMAPEFQPHNSSTRFILVYSFQDLLLRASNGGSV